MTMTNNDFNISLTLPCEEVLYLEYMEAFLSQQTQSHYTRTLDLTSPPSAEPLPAVNLQTQ
jgi:hypothetical protein